MSTHGRPADADGSPAVRLASEIDGALALLAGFPVDPRPADGTSQPPATLLGQCLELCGQYRQALPEPVRTVHHFACTGGTLICKCIASMPNTQLLSEVDPLSTPVKPPLRPQFAPTDMVTLMRQSTRGVDDKMIIDLFLGNLGLVYSDSVDRGLRLVVRDHAHTQFCRGPAVAERPNLLQMISSRFSTLSLVTVRDPINSYLSLRENKWVHFSPPSFDEYCARYLAFLRAYEGVPVVRFEDFVDEPVRAMAGICKALALPLNEEFQDLFGVYRITGDSGRSSDVIERRPRRALSDELAREMAGSENHERLRRILGYA